MKISSIFFLLSCLAITSNSQAQALDFEYISIIHLDRKPIVAATINGKQAYFLVDTGSDVSLLAENNADFFDYKLVSNNETNHNIEGLNGGKKSLKRVRFSKVTMGKSQIKGPWFAMDLSKLIAMVRKKSHITIHGIIGSDLMKKYDFTIDFNQRRVGFSTKHITEKYTPIGHISLYTLKSEGIDEIIRSQF